MPIPVDEITIVDGVVGYEERTPPFYWDYAGRLPAEIPVIIWNEWEWV